MARQRWIWISQADLGITSQHVPEGSGHALFWTRKPARDEVAAVAVALGHGASLKTAASPRIKTATQDNERQG